ncbi:putative leader peptide [Streptomyces canus]|uniref:putative leader peptide n=1 Tax=Streptomyces canus TaxID=58343 RepID=UPI0036F09ECD
MVVAVSFTPHSRSLLPGSVFGLVISSRSRSRDTPAFRLGVGPAFQASDEHKLTGSHRHGVLRIVTDTCVRLWRRVHMDLVRYAGCVCRPSC